MNPILKKIKNFFSAKRVIGDDTSLRGLMQADALLKNLVNEGKVPGMAVSVLKEGTTFFQKGYGHADLERKTPIHPQHTILRIASVSKNIAATALAYMVQDGLIDLDASFYDYVPYYPRKKWNFTMKQLAGHTAGLRGYKGTEYGLNKAYTIQKGIEIFKDDALVFEPGTDYLYTSFGWVLISLAMQEASGIPFHEYVQARVFNPLGMANTLAPESRTKLDKTPLKPEKVAQKARHGRLQRAEFYSKNRLGFRKAIPVDNYYKLAGGGYLSTSEDIAKFGQALLDGKLLNDQMKNEFLTSQSIQGKPTYYGLGWQASEDKNGKRFYGHVGNGVGGYANFFVYPEEKMIFVFLVNCTNPDVQEELDEVITVLLLHEVEK